MQDIVRQAKAPVKPSISCLLSHLFPVLSCPMSLYSLSYEPTISCPMSLLFLSYEPTIPVL